MAYSKFTKYYCRKCKSELSYSGARHGAKICRKCYYKTLSGKGNPMFGKITAKKHYCIDCNQIISKNSKLGRCHSCAAKNIWKTSTKIKNRNFAGQNNPNYLNGLSNLPYPIEFNDSLKESIRKRDDYECQNCGLTNEEHLIAYDESLPVHHIDYNKQNCKENNLITTCKQCNVRANYNRSWWQEFYTNKIRELYHV